MLSKRLSTALRFFTPQRGILFLAWLVVATANFHPNTWLIGWDNLLPEIDIFLNLQKTIFAAWQSWQGLGIVGGIGHASELSRQLMLLPLSVIFPPENIRFIWTLGMLLLGVLGTYQLSLMLFKKHAHVAWLSLLPALVYFFNLATVQNFFVPLEAFSTFWGFLPWFLLTAFRLLDSPTAKHVLIFMLVQFLGASAFHVQTMFIVFCIVLGMYSVFFLVTSKGKQLFSLVVLWSTLILAHFYWLAPVGYFTLTNANQTVESKQNIISTQEVYESNKAAGSPLQILQMKGYWFSYTDTQNGETKYLLSDWKKQTDSLPFMIAGVSVSILALAGYAFSLQKKSSDESDSNVSVYFFIAVTLISISMLSTGNGLLGLFYQLLTKLPLLGQVFRVPFTKWAVVYSFTTAFGVTYLVAYLLTQKRKVLALILGVCITVLSINTVLPIFSGELFYSNVKLSLPTEYKALFAELKRYPKEDRILYLPFDDFWGWMTHDWGYRGSGFVWYGIDQPIIDRNFDVWSVRNETLYTEFEYAFRTEDVQLVESLLKKYDITLLLVDTSLQTKPESLSQTQKVLTSLSTKGTIIPTWENNFLSLYAATQSATPITITQPQHIQPLHQRIILDGIYTQGSYLYDSSANTEYPMQDKVRESLTSNELSFESNQVLIPLSTGQLTVPNLSDTKQMFGIQIIGNNLTIEPIAPLYLANSESGVFHTIYTLQPISIPLDSLEDHLYLDINGKIIEVNETEYTQVILDQTVAENTTIRISNSSAILPKDAQTLVSTNHQTVLVPSETWLPLHSPKTVEVKENELLALTTLTESIPFSESESSSENCDPLRRGNTQKKVTDQSVIYTSESFGVACDGLSTKKIEANKNHFISLRSKNLAGLPIKFYIKNNETNSILLEHSAKNDTDYFFIPSDTNPGTISINIQNKSTGTQSTNELFDVTFQETPLSLINLARIQTAATDPSTQQKGPVAIESFTTQQGANFLYFASIFIPHQEDESTDTRPDSLTVTLSQSYDDGWIAFSTQSFPNQLTHVEVDGWKNGWIIDKGKTKLLIIYWPQLTIFAGYIFFAFALFHLLKKYKKQQNEQIIKSKRAKHLYRLPKRVLGGKR